MFFTYGEKQGNALFGTWEMRELAFDTMRRYLYYSAPVKESMIAPPNVGQPWRRGNQSKSSSNFTSPVTASAPQMPTAAPGTISTPTVATEPLVIAPPPPPPNLPSDIVWKKKIKVDKILLVAKEHEFLLDDVHLLETDLFQVEIHGELRPLQAGESPAPEPLLCPSTGLAGHPGRMKLENEDYTHDPLFLRELYEALRDQFNNLRMERERAEMASGASVTDVAGTREQRAKNMQTLQSPRKKEGHVKGSRIKLVFRLRIDYEFRRFWYVVQTVLGYDKLGTRPYRGLPPYDPRNGIVFGQIPIYCWHIFKALDKAVFYNFVRGDLVGRSTKGELAIVLRGSYLCVTHDTVFVLRNTGSIPRWLSLNNARDFYYNTKGSHPYLSFITDDATPDLIFIPQPPPFGPVAISTYNPELDVLKVLCVVKEACLASLEIRRVINIHEIRDLTVTQFAETMETQLRRRLQFDPVTSTDSSLSCPLPKEQLATVWREVQEIYASRDPTVVSQAAIPVYANNTNASALATEQVAALTRRLARERTSRDDIVGLSLEAAQQVPVDPHHATSGLVRRYASGDNVRSAVRSFPHSSTAPGSIAEQFNASASSPSSRTRPPLTRLPAADLVTPQLAASPVMANTPLDGGANLLVNNYSLTNASFTSSFGRSVGAESVQYGEPGAQYITAADLATSRPPHPSDYVVEHHVVVPQTPVAPGSTTADQFLRNTEPLMSDVMAASFTAMRQQRSQPNARNGGRHDPLHEEDSPSSPDSPIHIYHSTVET